MAIATLILAQLGIAPEIIPMMHTAMAQGAPFIRVLEADSTMSMATTTRYMSPSEAIPIDGKRIFQLRKKTYKT